MLFNVKRLLGKNIQATDGEIGKADDLILDADAWALRYLVVDTGPWIFGRKVLITHHALENIDWDEEMIAVNLSRAQVKDSPELDTVRMVSRPEEQRLHQYYGWPVYWQIHATPQSGAGPTPPIMPPQEPEEKIGLTESREPYLHRFSDLKGYKVEANDGELGHVEDFVIEAQDWSISYFIVDTGGWFQKGNHVMLAPHWITLIDSDESKIFIDLKKETIRSSPEFEPDRVFEEQ